MKKILIVDDETRVREMYVKMLVEEGFMVRHADDAQTALNIIVREDIDLILLDIKMPYIDGKTLFEVIKEYDPNLKVIVSSVYPIDKQQQMIPQAMDYFDKSQGLAHLLEKINGAFVTQ